MELAELFALRRACRSFRPDLMTAYVAFLDDEVRRAAREVRRANGLDAR
jgi:hypothetical protein